MNYGGRILLGAWEGSFGSIYKFNLFVVLADMYIVRKSLSMQLDF